MSKKFYTLIFIFAAFATWAQNRNELSYGNARPSTTVHRFSPNEQCNQIIPIPDDLTNGGYLGGNTGSRVAVDVPVEAGKMLTINQIKVSLARNTSINYVHFKFHSDSTALPGPELFQVNDTQIIAEDTLAYISIQLGYLRTFTVNLPTPVTLHGNVSQKYWMEVVTDARAWGSTPNSEDVIGESLAMRSNNFEWFQLQGIESLYEIHGDCVDDNGAPDLPCFQGDGAASNNFEDGYPFNATDTSIVADDFIVAPGTTFSVSQVKMHVLTTQDENFSDMSLNFRSNNAGVPDGIIQTVAAIVPTSQIRIGTAFEIFKVFEVTLDLPTPIAFTEGHYWLQPSANATSSMWEVTSTGSTGALAQSSNDSGITWQTTGVQAVFYIAGACEQQPPAGETCQQVFTGEISNGIGLIDDGANNRLRAANDITVTAGTQFELQKIILDVVTMGGEPNTFDVYLYSDNNGPGAQLASYQFIVPASIVPNGEFGASGYPVYTVALQLPSAYTLTADLTDKKYWIGLKADFSELSTPVFWVSSQYTENTASKPTYKSEDGGATWTVAEGEDASKSEGIMTVHGACEVLGTENYTTKDFYFYPNPVKNTLNIDAGKTIKSVSMYNLLGQNVKTQNINANNTAIEMQSLPSGIYVVKLFLENGNIEKTFKVIKE